MSCLCNLFGRRNGCYANFTAPSCNRTSPCMKVRCAADESTCQRCGDCCACGCGCGRNCRTGSGYGNSCREYQEEERCAYDYATSAYETERCHD